MLDAVGLRKRYGETLAVDGVGFRVEPGQTVGLLGPNGAGKTTVVSMIAGLVRPDSGTVQLDGQELTSESDPIKGRIGLVPQEVALYEELTARGNLEVFGRFYGLRGEALRKAAEEALAFVELTNRADNRVSTFSGGMQRRLNLAVALIHQPDLLILDEPTVGVDPQSRLAIFEHLEALRDRGLALVYTTHYMEEAERLCDRIVILDHGRVMANDTLAGLIGRLPAHNRIRIELAEPPVSEVLERIDLEAMPGIQACHHQGSRIEIDVDDLSASAPSILNALTQGGLRLDHFDAERADLEAVFLSLTGRSLRDT